MKKTKLLCIAMVAGALTFASNARSEAATQSPAKGGRVQIIFQQPEHFTDVRTRAGGETDPGLLDNLRGYLEQTAAPRLSEGTTLTVTFTDLDLAGAFVPPRATRQLKSVHPPGAKFSWVLTDASGAVVRQGTEELTDAGFLTQSNLKRDPLFYEKEMLGVWIRRTFR